MNRSGHPGTETGGKENEGSKAIDKHVAARFFATGGVGEGNGYSQSHDPTIDIVQIVKARIATVELFSLYYSVYDRERQVLKSYD